MYRNKKLDIISIFMVFMLILVSSQQVFAQTEKSIDSEVSY